MPSQAENAKRDAKFIKLWSDAGFDPAMKADCALTAGFSASASKRSTGKIINSLIQNQKMRKELKKAGVDLKRVAGKIAELMDAPHPLVAPRLNKETGKLVYAPDNFIQLKATDLAAKIHDVFAPLRIQEDKTETKQIVMSIEVVQRLERYNSQRALMAKGETFDVVPITDQQG